MEALSFKLQSLTVYLLEEDPINPDMLEHFLNNYGDTMTLANSRGSANKSNKQAMEQAKGNNKNMTLTMKPLKK
jgi:CheY-like chemotaxis protein